MKRKKDATALLPKTRLSRWAIAFQAMVRKIDPCELPQPARQEIGDLALELSAEKYTLPPDVQELFYWPPDAPPCTDSRCLCIPFLEEFVKKAEEELRLHYAHHYVLSLLGRRWRRANPKPRGWGWTKKPLLRPPKRRIFRPPDREGYPDAVEPPFPPPPGAPLRRPGWRDKEALLCFAPLFDNTIAFWKSLRFSDRAFTA